MIRVGIFGGSGYTGQELIRLLLGHPGVTLAAATSRRFAGLPVAQVYPHFAGLTDLVYRDDSPAAMAEKADVIFLALPHGICMDLAPQFTRTGRIVIDLSADFRIHDATVYEDWYGAHRATEVLGEAVYGLPEIHREALRQAHFVANPGCYPTSIILGLAPLLRAGWIEPASIIADSASGVSGAGREPQTGSLFCEVDGGFKAYKVAQHRHTPEIEQELSLLAGCALKISFTPHLLPVKRGILSTIYAALQRKVATEAALALYEDFYRDEPFVRIGRKGLFPNLSSVVGSNFCDIGLTVDVRTGRIVVVSAIDNLIKGASGQAIQNMNLLLGLDERTGLPGVALFP